MGCCISAHAKTADVDNGQQQQQQAQQPQPPEDAGQGSGRTRPAEQLLGVMPSQGHSPRASTNAAPTPASGTSEGFTTNRASGSCLMLPQSHLASMRSMSSDGTASSKLRSSLRGPGQASRVIPPKTSPLASFRRQPAGSAAAPPMLLGLDSTGGADAVAAYAHGDMRRASDAQLSFARMHGATPSPRHDKHAGHHGHGPPALAAAAAAREKPVEHDASTQLHSITSARSGGGRSLELIAGNAAVGAGVESVHGGGTGIFLSSPPLLLSDVSSDGTGSMHGMGSARKHRKHGVLRRQTSHRGLLSKLALQFPLVRASFQKVHKVFLKYHQERLRQQQQQEQQRKEGVSDTTDESKSNDSNNAVVPIHRVPTGQVQAGSVAEGGATFVTPAESVAADDAAAAAASTASVAAASSTAAAPASASASGSGAPSAKVVVRTSSGQLPPFHDEEISLDKLTEVLSLVSSGHSSSKHFSEGEVRELFQQSDLDQGKTISFREFLIAVSIGYFLAEEHQPAAGFASTTGTAATTPTNAKRREREEEEERKQQESAPIPDAPQGDAVMSFSSPSPSAPTPTAAASVAAASASAAAASASASVSPASPGPPCSPLVSAEFLETQRGFRVVQKAFRDIDVDRSGTVDVSELKRALFATAGNTDPLLLETRFAELDFNKKGVVTFPEFMYGFVSWVGFMEEETDA